MHDAIPPPNQKEKGKKPLKKPLSGLCMCFVAALRKLDDETVLMSLMCGFLLEVVKFIAFSLPMNWL